MEPTANNTQEEDKQPQAKLVKQDNGYYTSPDDQSLQVAAKEPNEIAIQEVIACSSFNPIDRFQPDELPETGEEVTNDPESEDEREEEQAEREKEQTKGYAAIEEEEKNKKLKKTSAVEGFPQARFKSSGRYGQLWWRNTKTTEWDKLKGGLKSTSREYATTVLTRLKEKNLLFLLDNPVYTCTMLENILNEDHSLKYWNYQLRQQAKQAQEASNWRSQCIELAKRYNDLTDRIKTWKEWQEKVEKPLIEEMNSIVCQLMDGAKIYARQQRDGQLYYKAYTPEEFKSILKGIDVMAPDRYAFNKWDKFRSEKDSELNTHVATDNNPRPKPPTLKMTPLASIWLDSPNRLTLHEKVFIPFHGECPAENSQDLNTWAGLRWTQEEVAEYTDWDLLIPLFNHMKFSQCESEEQFETLLKRAAIIIQRPDFKSGICLFFTGPQGAGKSGPILEWIGEIFGVHFGVVNRIEDLTGEYTAAMDDKILLLHDESTIATNTHDASIMKNLATGKRQRVRHMYNDPKFANNYVNIWSTNNDEKKAANVEQVDRRTEIYYSNVDPLLQTDVIKGLCDGDKKLYFEDLLNPTEAQLKTFLNFLFRMDLSDWNPSKPYISHILQENRLRSLPPMKYFLIKMLQHQCNWYGTDGYFDTKTMWQDRVLVTTMSACFAKVIKEEYPQTFSARDMPKFSVEEFTQLTGVPTDKHPDGLSFMFGKEHTPSKVKEVFKQNGGVDGLDKLIQNQNSLEIYRERVKKCTEDEYYYKYLPESIRDPEDTTKLKPTLLVIDSDDTNCIEYTVRSQKGKEVACGTYSVKKFFNTQFAKLFHYYNVKFIAFGSELDTATKESVKHTIEDLGLNVTFCDDVKENKQYKEDSIVAPEKRKIKTVDDVRAERALKKRRAADNNL
jgi:hypothetical protein